MTSLHYIKVCIEYCYSLFVIYLNVDSFTLYITYIFHFNHKISLSTRFRQLGNRC